MNRLTGIAVDHSHGRRGDRRRLHGHRPGRGRRRWLGWRRGRSGLVPAARARRTQDRDHGRDERDV